MSPMKKACIACVITPVGLAVPFAHNMMGANFNSPVVVAIMALQMITTMLLIAYWIGTGPVGKYIDERFGKVE